MLQITRIGENTKHDRQFLVDRPHGHPVLLLILVKTPARFLSVQTGRKHPPASQSSSVPDRSISMVPP